MEHAGEGDADDAGPAPESQQRSPSNKPLAATASGAGSRVRQTGGGLQSTTKSLKSTFSRKPEEEKPHEKVVLRDSLGRKTYEKTWLSGEGAENARESMRRQQLKEERAAERFASTLASIQDGLDRADGVNAVVDRIVRSAQDSRDRRKHDTHAEWQAEVFDKIQAQVEAHVDSISVPDLERSLLARSRAYCRTADSRGVFREVIDRETYDPFAYSKGACRVATAGLRDPLDRDLRKDAFERSLLRSAGCSYPLELPPVLSGMRRLAPPSWGPAAFSDSLHGRNYNTHGEVEVPKPHLTQSARLAALAGKIVIDHYSFPRDSGATATDFPAGGKAPVANSKVRADAVGRILTQGESVLASAKDKDAGDLWLDYRGKASVDTKPGSQRPRNMFEVVAMRDDPGAATAERGSNVDTWQEARGKQMTAAPRAGDPKELFEVLGSRSSQNIKVRDAWLTSRGRRPVAQQTTAGLLYLEKPTPAQRVPITAAPAAVTE